MEKHYWSDKSLRILKYGNRYNNQSRVLSKFKNDAKSSVNNLLEINYEWGTIIKSK